MSLKNVSIIHDENSAGSILSFHPAEAGDGEFDFIDIPEENIIRYENTYRMESQNPFNERKAIDAIQIEIEKYLNEETKYDPYESAKICAAMSLSIRNSITDLNFERYKIVCVVQIVEKKNQGVLSVVRFLRDLQRDTFVKKKFENHNLLAVVVVGALYCE